jgi:N,N'-diacetyllegionaminate synthase
MKVRIIAEAGVNHNGDFYRAKEMIDVAASCGADYVKFQSFSAEKLVTKFAPKAPYQVSEMQKNESQFQMLERLELSEEQIVQLKLHANMRSIGFLSTAFDIENLKLLDSMGQNIFKIPSGEINNLPYLRQVGNLGKPIIMSTGMASLEEVETALNVLLEVGAKKEDITILHCTSAYPAPYKDVNLLAMQTMRSRFGVAVGYSDHTLGTEVAIAAVAMGAKVIEKHFTLDKELPGPDHKSSLEPEELHSMIKAIRHIEISLGDGIKRLTSSEKMNVKISRKSIVARKRIEKGSVFTESLLTTKRPGTGISPMRWDSLIGRKASRNYEIDELIDES